MHRLLIGKSYSLCLPDGRPLGRVRLEKQVDDWLEGPFTPTPVFEAYRPLFEREAELRHQQIIPLWEEAMNAIEAMEIQVVPDGETRHFSRLRIYVEGNEAIVGAPL